MKSMKRSLAFSTLSVVFLFVTSYSLCAEDWPGWRGPRGDGTSLEKNIPTRCDAGNLLWKTALPGTGHASPIVWGDRVFIVTALTDKEDRVLLCLDRVTGKILWQKTVLHAALETIHGENSFASGTPATDGEKIYVSFLDGEEAVVAAYDFSGKQIWESRPGTFSSPHGYSASPVLYQDKVIINADSKGDAFLAALSRTDGKTLWKVKQEYPMLSYSTPLIREAAGRMQMFHSGSKSVAGHDPNDGSRIWVVDGPADEFVASPIYNERLGLVFISSGYPKQIILAIKPDGRGDVSESHVAWRANQGAPYVPSLINEGDYLLSISNKGVAFCYEAATGKILWQEKLGKHHASPVSAGGLVYFLNDDGVMNVIKPGKEFTRVAASELGEKTYASPAVSHGQLFLRGEKHLFCFKEKK
jgi:outer membrane protein assembly factor BamB